MLIRLLSLIASVVTFLWVSAQPVGFMLTGLVQACLYVLVVFGLAVAIFGWEGLLEKSKQLTGWDE